MGKKIEKLSKEEVEHLARLARISLSEAEVDHYATELSQVVDYIEQLNEVDVSRANLTEEKLALGVTGLKNVIMEDVARPKADADRLSIDGAQVDPDRILGEAPMRSGDYFAVRAVLSNGEES